MRLLLGLCAAIMMPLLASATDITGSFAQDIPPFLWEEEGQIKGIQLDIMRAALEPMGYRVLAKPLPIKRMWGTFLSGDLDFAAGLQLGEVPGVLYSDEFLEYADAAISKAARHIHLQSPNDLFKYRVITWQKAFRDLGLDRLHLPDAPPGETGGFIETPDSESQVRFFMADRADVLVMDRYIYYWYVKQLRIDPAVAQAVNFDDVFEPQIKVRIGFKDQKLCDDFNEGLKRIRANGEYQKIFVKYGLPANGAEIGAAPR